jgi:hypothetical protein
MARTRPAIVCALALAATLGCSASVTSPAAPPPALDAAALTGTWSFTSAGAPGTLTLDPDAGGALAGSLAPGGDALLALTGDFDAPTGRLRLTAADGERFDGRLDPATLAFAGTRSSPTQPGAPAVWQAARVDTALGENALPGSTGWKLRRPAPAAADGERAIEGYASATSVAPGDPIDLFVNVTNGAPTFSLEIYRLGWYGGAGARLVERTGGLRAIHQAACAADARRTVACDWEVSYHLDVPRAWPSGAYLVKLITDEPAPLEQYATFVVRDDAGAQPMVLALAVNTYQAYNTYGGNSLYGPPTDHPDAAHLDQRSYAVSFDRPYANGDGAGDLLRWEYPFIRWAERNGFAIGYLTSLDVHLDAARFAGAEIFLSVGHDEYWSRAMRDHVEAALAGGTSLGFFGADAIYWQARYEQRPSAAEPRTLVCYKRDWNGAARDPVGDPRQVTVRFRDRQIGDPEDALLGVMYDGWFRAAGAADLAPLVVTNTHLWPFDGTGLREHDRLPGLVGYEFDRLFGARPWKPASCDGWPDVSKPREVTILAASPVASSIEDGGARTCKDVANATLRAMPNGALVFAAGTVSWSWGLDDSDYPVDVPHAVAAAPLQRLTLNLLNGMGDRSPRRAAPPRAPIRHY